jgi:hypothetical protein
MPLKLIIIMTNEALKLMSKNNNNDPIVAMDPSI